MHGKPLSLLLTVQKWYTFLGFLTGFEQINTQTHMVEVNKPKLIRSTVNKILSASLVFIFINIGLSVLLTYGVFESAEITQSQYALIGGIPHPLLGVIFYTLIFVGIGGVVLRVPFNRILKFLRPQMVLDLSRWASYVAALFAFYLSYSEISILGIVSVPYLIQQLLIFVILGFEIWGNAVIVSGKKETQVCEFC